LKDVRKLQKTVVAALEDIKARDIEVFDVTHITAMFDRVIVATAESGRQLAALARNVQARALAEGWRTSRIEGENSGEWVLVDLGDVVVHILQPEARLHYNLEELWNHPKPKEPKVTARKPPSSEVKSASRKPPKKTPAKKAAKRTAAKPAAKAARKTPKKPPAPGLRTARKAAPAKAASKKRRKP
jgi:ribosome-associated protein